MGNPYLNNDESIILATHNVLFRSVRSDVILTNQRLILSDTDHAQFRPRSIPLAVIMTVTSAETGTGDPGLSLSVATPDGATAPRELVFAQKPNKKRDPECNEWIKKIGELAALARENATRTGVQIKDLAAAMAAEELAIDADAEGAAGSQPAQGSQKKPSPGACRRQFPMTSSKKVAILAIAAIIIVAVVLVVGVYVNSLPLRGNPVLTAVPTVVPTTAPPATATIAPTTVPTTVQSTPTKVVTTAPTPVSQIVAPPEGVWVRVDSPVMYAGTVGVSGNLQDINATGVNYYRIPAAQTSVVDITVQKQSGYRDPLTIMVYNNGRLIKNSTTTLPMGTIELHMSLNAALTNGTS